MSRAAGWLLVALVTAACGAPPEPRAVPARNVTALVGGRVQPDPEAAVVSDGVVLITDGRITAVGRRTEVAVPAGATVIDCAGGTVTAGFWNSHVHSYMREAGLSYARILAALTTAPAARFGAAARTGRLAPGLDADVVVLDGDPAEDIRALGRVRATLRSGRVIYRRAP